MINVFKELMGEGRTVCINLGINRGPALWQVEECQR